MDAIEKLKTLMAVHSAKIDFEQMFEKLSQESQDKVFEALNSLNSDNFDTKAIKLYKEEVGSETFATLAMSPAFKSLIDEFKAKLVRKHLAEVFEILDEATKKEGIENKFTVETFSGVMMVIAHITTHGTESFMRS